ncbi:acetyl xylan esterase A [Anaeromyces robustus]|uniref:Acetyl xylan esterase A n=1 Tax=Anaeromyces robustus TaxID=1754192 RepID=A0A1Y1XCZ3_9FUNG|nr:acetyl xylan esterase A [Anaeromyces robustus]|eukprot:ORX83244.1 acetyl xylan esterase A [Anaeromyces robustus]
MAESSSKPDPNFHIYLAFGQSNMEGQGTVDTQDKIEEKRFKVISTDNDCAGRKLGQWYPAIPPIVNNFGKLGPLDYFGRTLVKKLPENITIGVVPVAIAGCDIQLFEEENYKEYTYTAPDWMQDRINHYGGNPFRRLVDIAKIAQKSGIIKGILLHQGETNNGQEDWPKRIKVIYEALLKELNLKAENVPLLAGEVVRSEYEGVCSPHNEIIKKLPDVIPTAHVISAEGLKDEGDNLHFSSESYRIFGERYANKMFELLNC